VRESYPIDRASSMTNSRVYFCHIRWNGTNTYTRYHCRS